MFRKDELRLEFKMGKGEWILGGENQMRIVCWFLTAARIQIQEDSKKGKGCNLRVRGIKSQEACGDIWIKGQLKHRKHEVFTTPRICLTWGLEKDF